MSWWRPADDLSQVQLRIVDLAVSRIMETPSGACVWVQGCAGTGKTLVLAHVARRLRASNANIRIIFLTYTHALTAMIRKTVSQSGVTAEVSTYYSFLHSDPARHYDVIVLDEIQDVKLPHLHALKSRCTHMIVAGDCEQRIYEGANTEDAIDGTIVFEKARLIELFRITRYIVKVAQKILPSTRLVEGDTSGIKRDVSIAVRQFGDPIREAMWVYTEAMSFARPGYPSAILLPHHRSILSFCHSLANRLGIAGTGPSIAIENGRITDYAGLNNHFRFHGVPVRYLGNGIGNVNEADSKPFVFVMTYHSSKGLDFDNVYMPLLDAGLDLVSPHVLAEMKELARTLFFVAITRSRERLVLTYTGQEPHPYIGQMPKEVVSFTTDDPKREITEEDELF